MMGRSWLYTGVGHVMGSWLYTGVGHMMGVLVIYRYSSCDGGPGYIQVWVI